MLDLGRTLLYVTEREPSATAIIDGDTTLTYGEWLERTLRTVAGLDAIGAAAAATISSPSSRTASKPQPCTGPASSREW